MAYMINNSENNKKNDIPSIDKSKYVMPISISIIGVVGILAIIIGLILGIIPLFLKSLNNLPFIIIGIALVISGIFLFVLFRVTDDIHYVAFLIEEQAINSKTTISYYDASIELLTQQRDALDEIVEKQDQIIESLKRKDS